MNIVLTGASGFVGGCLVQELLDAEHQVTAVIRRLADQVDPRASSRVIAEFTCGECLGSLLHGQDLVVHCAARVHVIHDISIDPLVEFRKINVEGTMNLARHAAEAGVGRFIFISSIKVNGENTASGQPFLADEQPAPADPYGISKMEAEQGLRALASETGMEVVIIRPTLVYGPGVKANFLNMMRWLYRGIPLPFGAINNRRSLVALDNLVDLIVTCIDHPAAANQTFLVSDGEDLSTTELLLRVGSALGKPARLLPVPSWLLETGATMLGKKALSQRLCGTLQVDISKTRELLNWTPPVSVDEALRKTAEAFLASRAGS